MKKIKVLLVISMILLCGCNKYSKHEFNTSTGDTIEIKIKTNDGYDITDENPFYVKKDNNNISFGTFINNEIYDTLVYSINKDELVKNKEEGKKKNISYISYEYNGQYIYLIKIMDSNTNINLVNRTNKEEANKVFNLLEFKLK